MKLTVKAGDLKRELGIAGEAVSTKGAIPILNNVLLAAEGERLSILGTDLDLSIRTDCAAVIEAPGSVVALWKLLHGIVVTFADEDEMLLELGANDWLTVSHGDSTLRMCGLAVSHFPAIPHPDTAQVQVPAARLCSLLNRVVFAVTSEESRYSLAGVLVKFSKGQIEAVATDGHRLSAAVEASGCDIVKQVILPKRGCAILTKMFTESKDDLSISWSSEGVFFTGEGREVMMRELKGEFPKYETLLPKSGAGQVLKVAAAALASAVKRASLLSEDTSHSVVLTFEKGLLKVSADSEEGKALETVAVDYQGDPLVIKFDATYMLEYLSASKAKVIRFLFQGSEMPGLFSPDNEDDWRYLVMPQRL